MNALWDGGPARPTRQADLCTKDERAAHPEKNERKEITEHLAEVVASQRRSTPARDSALLAGAVAVAAA